MGPNAVDPPRPIVETGYSLDSCFLMDLCDRHYPRDVFGQLWDNLEGLVIDRRAFIVDAAAEECRSDDLRAWLAVNGPAIAGDADTWSLAAQVVSDVETKHGVVAVETSWSGAGAADPFVIALAMQYGLTVVTSEKIGTAERPQIPMVCRWCDVPCINGVDFFRREGWRF